MSQDTFGAAVEEIVDVKVYPHKNGVPNAPTIYAVEIPAPWSVMESAASPEAVIEKIAADLAKRVHEQYGENTKVEVTHQRDPARPGEIGQFVVTRQELVS